MWNAIGNWFRRLLTVLIGAVLIAAGLWIALTHLGVTEPDSWGIPGLEIFFFGTPNILQGVGIGTAGVALGLVLLFVSVTGLSRPERMFRLRIHGSKINTSRGEVSVAEAGLLKMLAWTAEDIEGISGVAPQLELKQGGWDVRCVVSLWTDIPLTEAVDELRRRVRHALEHHTGVQVNRIDVVVQHNPLPGRPELA